MAGLLYDHPACENRVEMIVVTPGAGALESEREVLARLNHVAGIKRAAYASAFFRIVGVHRVKIRGRPTKLRSLVHPNHNFSGPDRDRFRLKTAVGHDHDVDVLAYRRRAVGDAL